MNLPIASTIVAYSPITLILIPEINLKYPITKSYITNIAGALPLP